jgi:hypothetical protein
MEATCSYETSVDTQRTTRRYIPEDGALHNHRCEILKFYIIFLNGIQMFSPYYAQNSGIQFDHCMNHHKKKEINGIHYFLICSFKQCSKN